MAVAVAVVAVAVVAATTTIISNGITAVIIITTAITIINFCCQKNVFSCHLHLVLTRAGAQSYISPRFHSTASLILLLPSNF